MTLPFTVNPCIHPFFVFSLFVTLRACSDNFGLFPIFAMSHRRLLTRLEPFGVPMQIAELTGITLFGPFPISFLLYLATFFPIQTSVLL